MAPTAYSLTNVLASSTRRFIIGYPAWLSSLISRPTLRITLQPQELLTGSCQNVTMVLNSILHLFSVSLKCSGCLKAFNPSFQVSTEASLYQAFQYISPLAEPTELTPLCCVQFYHSTYKTSLHLFSYSSPVSLRALRVGAGIPSSPAPNTDLNKYKTKHLVNVCWMNIVRTEFIPWTLRLLNSNLYLGRPLLNPSNATTA